MKRAPVVITERAPALVSKHTGFDLSNPAGTKAHNFIFVSAAYVKDGVLDRAWTRDGYRLVGWAEIKVEIMPTDDMLNSTIEALKAEKVQIRAAAQAAETRIEGEIQKLLALSYDVTGE